MKSLLKQKRHNIALLFISALVVISAIAFAAEPAKPDIADTKIAVDADREEAADEFMASLTQDSRESDKEESKPLYLTVLGFVFRLAIVIGLLYVTLLGVKKFSVKTGAPILGNRGIRVVENTTLGANRTIHLVEVGSKRLLVASTPNQINLIAELEKEDIVDPRPESTPPSGGFKDQLNAFLGVNPDSGVTGRTVAQLLRESSTHIQDRVGDIGLLRRKFRNAD